MNKIAAIVTSAFILMALTGSLLAQPAATAPAPAPAAGAGLQATITGVEGLVQVRLAEDQPWQRAQVGMKLDQGAEFRTGPRSAVRFVIPPDQTVTLDRLGTVKLLQAIRDAKKVKTDLGMKYGRTRYDIEAAGIEHESMIHSPAATLAVRGTKVSVYDQAPFAPEVRSLTGRAVYDDRRGRKVAFGKNRPTLIGGGNGNAAQTAENATKIDPQSPFARTGPESLLLLSLAAYGGTSFKDIGVLEFLDLARAGQFEGSVVGTLPVGVGLNFSLLWSGAPQSNLDLSILSPRGELLDKDHLQTPSSGVFNGDQVANGRGIGQESAQWVISFPRGNYQVKASLVGGGSAQVTIFAIRDPLGDSSVIANVTGQVSSESPTFTTTVRAAR